MTKVITQSGEQPNKVITLESWRVKGLAILRVVFGSIWAVDASFKWQPDFVQNFTDYLTGALEGQPPSVQWWIHLWHDTIQVNPVAFAHLVAISETALAIGLIFGVFSNITYLGGTLLSVVIWSTAEGFGGPYKPGSTDIGAAIIYVLVFAGLFLTSAGRYWGLDRWLTPRLGRLGFLASGAIHSNKPIETQVTAILKNSEDDL